MRILRFKEVFDRLFSLCSVEILKEIQTSKYELLNSEIYKEDELELIQTSAYESVRVFAADIFQNDVEKDFERLE